MHEGEQSDTDWLEGLDEAAKRLLNKMHFSQSPWDGKELVSCFLLVAGMDRKLSFLKKNAKEI